MSKHILSLSLGSSTRNKIIDTQLIGCDYRLERRGSDGNLALLESAIKEADGNVDIITLGGIDINFSLLDRKYPFKDANKLVMAARKTPIVDGEYFREWVEPLFVKEIYDKGIINKDKRVLFPLAANRLSIARQLYELGFEDIVYGDLIYDIGFPQIPIHSIKAYNLLGKVVGPVLTRLPFTWLYPSGEKQEESHIRKPELFSAADIIAGDFHNIRRFLIDDLSEKIIITNTVTEEDRKALKERNLKTLVTFSPCFDGRTFGANMIDGIIINLLGKEKGKVGREEYLEVVRSLKLKPNIEVFG